MNPFLTLLITLPLIATALLMFVMLGILVEQGPRWDNLPFFIIFIIFGGIAVYLVRLLRRTATAEGRIVELPVSPDMKEATRPFRKRLTTMVLLEVYGLAGCVAIAAFGFESLRYWIGGICFILGILFLISAWLADRSFQQVPSGPEARAAQVAWLDQSLTTTRNSRNYIVASYPLIWRRSIFIVRSHRGTLRTGDFCPLVRYACQSA